MKTLRYCLILMLFPMSLFSKDPIEAGAQAPTLTVTTHKGESLDLAELYASGPVLVYFYPKSDTPGCTRQACNLRDNFGELQKAGVSVVGVSIDDVKSQSAFQEKYDLPFTLVADEDKRLGSAFGVASMMGMAYKRQSFLIVDGKVAWVDLKATPDSQTQDALAALEKSK